MTAQPWHFQRTETALSHGSAAECLSRSCRRRLAPGAAPSAGAFRGQLPPLVQP